MIDFAPLTVEDKRLYNELLPRDREIGCDRSFANLFLWGRQRAAVLHGHMVLFSQYNRRSVYPFPLGTGDKKAVLDAIMEDAAARGIPCRLTGLGSEDIALLQALYPDRFRFHCDRDAFDYVYSIDDLADLKGKRYHKKRTHFNRFLAAVPHHSVSPLDNDNAAAAAEMVAEWYAKKREIDPVGDYFMEEAAIKKAFANREALELEGLVLADGDRVLAVTMGSRLSHNTFDVQFEKARTDVDGAYTAINKYFATYIREKYPDVAFLNREEDMGIEGLRKAKESYYPHHMVEKCWACLLEDGCEY